MASLVAIATSLGTFGATAGDLDPPASPAPTMKTLDEVPGSWSRQLSSTDGIPSNEAGNLGCDSSRFKCLWPDPSQGVSQAVLDRETGLVWQRSVANDPADWPTSRRYCANLTLADRMGWRLPSTAEISSLVVPNGDSAGLPTSHPFLNVVSGMAVYANTWFVAGLGEVITNNTTGIRIMRLTFNGASTAFTDVVPNTGLRRWCVRGPNSGGL